MMKRLIIAALMLASPAAAQVDATLRWRIETPHLPFDLVPTRHAWIRNVPDASHFADASLICDPDGRLRLAFRWSPGDRDKRPLEFLDAQQIAWRVADKRGMIAAAVGRQRESDMLGGYVRFSPADPKAGLEILEAMIGAPAGAHLVIGVGDRIDGWLTTEFPLDGFTDVTAEMLAECRF